MFQLNANPVCLLDHEAVGDDIALRIHNHAGAERTFPNAASIRSYAAATTGTLSLRTAKEAIKKVLERILIVVVAISATRRAHAAVGIFNGGFGIDVDDAGLQ